MMKLKNLHQANRTQVHHLEGEQGIALVLALLMGFLLIAGSSALLVRKLVERKIGAFTSYQQMAENAAISGFNHILSQLNNPTRAQYKGYLYEVGNIPGSDEQWTKIATTSDSSGIELEEMCTPTQGSYALPDHPTQGAIWPIDFVPLSTSNPDETLREDGSLPVVASYRLRDFTSNFASDQAIGIFSIEGLIKRNNTVLARTLLTRSLDIKFVVADEADWAVMNADQFIGIQSLQVDGEGIILINKDQSWTKNCNQSSLENDIGLSVSGDTSPLIWPVRERGIPGPVIYEQNRRNDMDNNKLRVWSFDDSGSIDRGINCTEIACVREEGLTSTDDFINASTSGSIKVDNNTNSITLKGDQICKGGNADSPCHLNVEYMNLNDTKIFIENSKRPVVIHLISPNTSDPSPSAISTGSIRLASNSLLCGVNAGSSSCNDKPERFIITNGSKDGDYQNRCLSSQGILDIGGGRLPAAMVTLQSGTFSLNEDTTIHGLIWAQNICGNNHSLTVKSQSVVDDAERVWKWRENDLWGGNGRQTIRGIRGSGMDLFEKF